jgi:wyosine [tRNA(Phe)-imidazoG37] synthetase (radical SAM superfamily)
MNERIKQLAEQAGAETWSRAPMRAVTGLAFTDENLEKFAELIVQECIDIIAPYTVRMSRPGEEYLHPILEIKQHFGVDE